jgi:hypothetical protein
MVGVFSPSYPDDGVVFHSVALAGGASATAPLYKAREVRDQLADSGAGTIFCHQDFLDVVEETVRGAAVDSIYVIGWELLSLEGKRGGCGRRVRDCVPAPGQLHPQLPNRAARRKQV